MPENDSMNKVIRLDNCISYQVVSDNSPDLNEDTEKKIKILGTNNRYKMKKVMNQNETSKKRVVSTKWNIDSSFLKKDEQLKIANDLFINPDTIFKEKSIVAKELDKKIQGYKQQDVDKKIFDADKFINISEVLKLFIDCSLCCHYCNEDVFILYEIVRETKQWTLDRIDNSVGHNCDNVIISCLSCNLQRRCQSKEKFSFTKQMKIYRENY